MTVQNPQLVTIEYFLTDAQHDLVRKNIFLPDDLYQTYKKSLKQSRFRSMSPQKLEKFFMANGGFLCGKNAIEETDCYLKTEIVNQSDYDDKGNLLETRHYSDGRLARTVYGESFTTSYRSYSWIKEVEKTKNIKRSLKHTKAIPKQILPYEHINITYMPSAESTGPQLQLRANQPKTTIAGMTLAYTDNSISVSNISAVVNDPKAESSCQPFQVPVNNQDIALVNEDIQLLMNTLSQIPENLKDIAEIIIPVLENQRIAKEYNKDYTNKFGNPMRSMALKN